MNTMRLQDLVKGNYGRKIAYADVEEINESNIVSVIGSCIGVFNYNKSIFKYLWDYKNGDQPTRYRKKTMRDDVNNPIVENHAWEIVRFKNGQTNGEPIQCVCTVKDEEKNKGVDRFNDLCKHASKHARDIASGEWTSATGTGFKAVQRRRGSKIPFAIVVPSPMNTFIIYSSHTFEPLLSVQEIKDEKGEWYKHCFSETHEYKVKDGRLLALETLEDGVEIYSRLHAFGGIPIVEYPNNQDRLSDIEIVIDLLDAINDMQSNRMDAIEQFVQSWMKFVNCEIDETTFAKMKMMGALVVKSNNADNRADVDVITQELNQTEAQVAKDDLWNNALTISAIPNKQGNTGGDTQGAVELRNGWDFSKQAAKLKDPYTIEAERRLNKVILNVIRQEKGDKECPFDELEYDVQISHSPTDNMQVKAQVLQLLLSSGIHPLVAVKTCGLWADAEKIFLLSKPYMDALYKTIDDEIKNQGLGDQVNKANELINQFNNQKNKAAAE